MHYWLMKSEPEAFSIGDLQAMPEQTEHWDGVRNYQARNMLRDEMKKGDLVFFYHSNCPQPAIVGIMQVVRGGYPDFTAFDPNSKHFDPHSDPDKPRWMMVDVQFVRTLKRPIPLSELRQYHELAGMQLLRKGNRLSITPLSEEQWAFILSRE
ncbi:MAG TPA: EVE domain-containing protein [Geopsychrobacteraceae bacterium]